MVDSVDTRADTDSVQKSILMSVKRRRSNDGSFGEGLPHSHFSFVFGAVECRGGIGRSVEMGKVDESRNAGEVGDSGDSSSAGDVDVVEGEVPVSQSQREVVRRARGCVLGFVISPDEVVNGVGVSQTFLNLSVVVEIPFLSPTRSFSTTYDSLKRRS